MGGKRVLVVATVAAEEDELRSQVGEAGEIRVVSPATRVSKLDWLTGDEDDARAEARRTAAEVAGAVGGEVDPTSQNTDAAQDVDDALRTFRPDEIVVVTRAGDDSTWLDDDALRKAVEASGVPVRHVAVGA